MEDSTEERDVEVTESVRPIETGGCNQQMEWSKLPSLPLERIYSFLSRADQIKMSQVCLRWSEGYSLPSVWKTFKFYLTGSELAMDTCPEVKFARKYGSMFRNVEIVCRRINLRLIDTSCRHLQVFLNTLTNTSQLHSIKFRSLAFYLHQLDTPIYNGIFREITSFLQSQRHLKQVEFHDCCFKFREGVELLKSVTENSKESLTHLVIQGFVHDESLDQVLGVEQDQDLNIAQSLPTLVTQRFPSLTTLQADYSLVFEKMFQSFDTDMLKNCQMRSLSKIILRCDGSRRANFRGLTSTNWRYLRRLCPDLKVELYFVPGSQSRREIEFFILPGMPITLLDYRLDRLHASSNIEIGTLFDHLIACGIENYLVSLYIVWMVPIPDLASPFIPFLQAFTKLKCLQLFTMYAANGVDLLLRSLQENRPEGLEELFISLSNVRHEDEFMGLMTIAEEYVPLLQVMGIDTFLIFDHAWR